VLAAVAGEKVLYKDGLDSSVSWIAYVQHVFRDGLWVYVEGAPLDVPLEERWNPYEHHCLVCTATDPDTDLANPNLDRKHYFQWGGEEREKRMFLLDQHVR
jgi:hypothetical protein